MKMGGLSPSRESIKEVSLRTSPQAGVAIPKIEAEILDFREEMLQNPGDSHADVRHFFGMTWFFDSLKGGLSPSHGVWYSLLPGFGFDFLQKFSLDLLQPLF